MTYEECDCSYLSVQLVLVHGDFCWLLAIIMIRLTSLENLSACKLIRNKWKRPLQKKKKVDRYNAFRKYKK